MMRRRVLGIGLAALLVVPERVSAQQARAKIPRVGILASGDNERAPMFDAFRAGLRHLGYVEGRNIILEFRFARGDRSLGPKLAAELLALPVDVIVSEGVGPRSAVDSAAEKPERPHSDRVPGHDEPCRAWKRRQPSATRRGYHRLHPNAHRAQRQARETAA